ncbi:hypothetical protein ACUY4R_001628 [Kosakonia sp. BK9b]
MVPVFTSALKIVLKSMMKMNPFEPINTSIIIIISIILREWCPQFLCIYC